MSDEEANQEDEQITPEEAEVEVVETLRTSAWIAQYLPQLLNYLSMVSYNLVSQNLNEALKFCDVLYEWLIPSLRNQLGKEKPSDVVSERIKDMRGWSFLRLGAHRDYSLPTVQSSMSEFDIGDIYLERNAKIVEIYIDEFTGKVINILNANDLLVPTDHRLGTSDMKEQSSQVNEQVQSLYNEALRKAIRPNPA